jgi:trigger factor
LKLSDGLVREIEVEVPADEVDAAFSEKFNKYRKQARIKGFRPGKAPLNLIKSMFSDAVHDEVLQELVRTSYPKALEQHDLKAISQPEFPKMDLQEGRPLTYTAKFEVMPVIESINLEGLQLPDEEITVHDSEVDAVVHYLRKKHAIIRPVERPAGEDDIVVVDLQKLDDPDNILKDSEFKDTEIDLGSGITVQEFRDNLRNTKSGDQREITVNYPDDYSAELLQGKTIKYRCQVKEVRERKLPPEDDAFARTQGKDIATMLELRLKIREDLKKQKAHDQWQWQKDQLRHQIIQKNQISIPESMISNYIESVIEELKQQKRPFDEKEVNSQYRPMAEDAIRWNLLRNYLTGKERIEVLPSDTEDWIKGFAESNNLEVGKAREFLGQTGRIQEIRDSILEEKVFKFVLPNVEYVPITPVSDVTIDAGEAEKDDKDKNITEDDK